MALRRLICPIAVPTKGRVPGHYGQDEWSGGQKWQNDNGIKPQRKWVLPRTGHRERSVLR